jgi:hypothetical protein
MTTSRKLFSQNVTIPAATPVSMESLMQTAGWGYEYDPTTNVIDTTMFSMDSFEGNGGSILPAGDVYVGYDQFVRNVAAAGPPRYYQGALAAATLKFGLDDFCRGIVDPSRIWFYSVGGTTGDLVLDGF